MNLRKENKINELPNILIINQTLEEYLKNPKKVFEKQWVKNIPIKGDHQFIIALQCEKDNITAAMSNGKIISIPTSRFKRLREASLEQLQNFEIAEDGYDIHWPDIDEDISVKAFLNNDK